MYNRIFKRMGLKTILSVIAIAVSILALMLSGIANHKSNTIAEDNLIFQKETESINRVNSTYNKIIYGGLRDVRMKIRNNELIEGKQPNFQLFIDELEGLASLYCDGKVKEQHLNDIFKGILTATCQNKQVIKVYGGFKNGLSKLCALYIGSEGMGQFYHQESCKKFSE